MITVGYGCAASASHVASRPHGTSVPNAPLESPENKGM